MPNIELHGYNHEDYQVLGARLFKTFADVGYSEDVVITRAESLPRTIKNVPAPFLRVYITSDEPATNEDLEARLREIGVDVEIVELKKFIPKKE